MPGQPAHGSNRFITFECSRMWVREMGLPETTVIEKNRTWQVMCEFDFQGMFAPWLVSRNIPVQFEALYESIGGGPEGSLGKITLTTQAGQLAYGPGQPGPDPIITVTGGTLPPGLYKLAGVVTFPGSPPPPMAAFHDGPIVQIIE